uniref:Secreted protein n=1 Tax=Meloidogyne javanica TaxID=6303 RepID=A0A915N0E3_MELJA
MSSNVFRFCYFCVFLQFLVNLIIIPSIKCQQQQQKFKQKFLLINKNNFETSPDNIFKLGKELKYSTEWKRKMQMLLRRNYLIKSARKMKNRENTVSE